jgi:hypothetical protein
VHVAAVEHLLPELVVHEDLRARGRAGRGQSRPAGGEIGGGGEGRTW